MDVHTLSLALEMMAVSSDTKSIAHDMDIIVECSQLNKRTQHDA